MSPTKQDYISGYRSLGLTPIPLYGYNEGACSCGATACTSAGKHPRVKRQTAIEATEDKWQSWIKVWPDMNIGILTGSDTGIFVVDIDPRHGGDKSLAALEAKFGKFPATAVATTGGGGIHYLFRAPLGITIRNSAGDEVGSRGVAPGIDIRGDGGLIVVEPSVTKGAYRWN